MQNKCCSDFEEITFFKCIISLASGEKFCLVSISTFWVTGTCSKVPQIAENVTTHTVYQAVLFVEYIFQPITGCQPYHALCIFNGVLYETKRLRQHARDFVKSFEP